MLKSTIAIMGILLMLAVTDLGHADETWTVNWSGTKLAGRSENDSGSFTVTFSSKSVSVSGTCPKVILLEGEHNHVNTRLRAGDCSSAFDVRGQVKSNALIEFEYSLSPACATKYDDTFEFVLTNGAAERGFYRWTNWHDLFGRCSPVLRADYFAGFATGTK